MTAATEQKPRPLTPHELAFVVRTFREMRGWSQEQMAEISKVATRTVQRVEEGQAASLDTRRALASALDFEDVDAFNKPYVFPTAEELAAEKERLEKERVLLKVERIETGKQLARLAEGCDAFLFTEGMDLASVSAAAEESFARVSDYCRDYGDCAELYSASDKLEVYEELGTYVSSLVTEGVCLVAASRAVTFKAEGAIPAHPMEILYVIAFPKERVPEHIAVQRRVRFA